MELVQEIIGKGIGCAGRRNYARGRVSGRMNAMRLWSGLKVTTSRRKHQKQIRRPSRLASSCGRLFSFRDHTLCDRSEARSCHGVLGQLRLAVTFRVLANLHFQAVIQLLFQWASPLALSRSHHNLLHDMALLGNVLGFSAIGLLSRFGQLGIQKRNLFESELWDHSPSRTTH